MKHVTRNPYEGVDWSWMRAKGNFHTHTTWSDGNMAPAAVIDAYKALGYHILMVTDHDSLAQLSGEAGGPWPMWPWPEIAERDPGQLGMLTASSIELSWSHDIAVWGTDLWTPTDVDTGMYEQYKSGLAWLMDEIGVRGGLGQLAHPGRMESGGQTDQWYADAITDHPHLVGMETYNQGRRHPDDLARYGRALTLLREQGRNHTSWWQFSVDDSHHWYQIGRNYCVLLMPELTLAAMREALIKGRFWIVYDPIGVGGARHERASRPDLFSAAPILTDVRVTDQSITLHAAQWSAIRWVTENEVQVGTGPRLDLGTPDLGSWVRAELDSADSSGAITLTQPWYLDPAPLPGVLRQ